MSELGGDEKECPFCAEVIKARAIKCKHCGESLAQSTTQRPVGTPAPALSVPASPPVAPTALHGPQKVCCFCDESIGRDAHVCPRCGKDFDSPAPIFVPASIQPVFGPATTGEKTAANCLMIAFGLALMAIPVIGWILGPALIIGSFFAKGSDLDMWRGQCPYCLTSMREIGTFVEKEISCALCKKPVRLHDSKYFKVMAQGNGVEGVSVLTPAEQINETRPAAAGPEEWEKRG